MSTRAQLRDRLRYRLANRTDLSSDDTRIDGWLDDALLDLCTQRIEIRSLQAQADPITSSIGVFAYPLPTGAFSLTYLEDTTNSKKLTRFDGGFESFLNAKQNQTNSTPERFIERGSSFYVLPAPDVATISWTPYVYNRPTWDSDPSAVPSIEPEWHYAIGLIAAEMALRDLGDPETAAIVLQEFNDWLGRRDTAIRRTVRHHAPVRGIQPAVAHRSPRTGV